MKKYIILLITILFYATYANGQCACCAGAADAAADATKLNMEDAGARQRDAMAQQQLLGNKIQLQGQALRTTQERISESTSESERQKLSGFEGKAGWASELQRPRAVGLVVRPDDRQRPCRGRLRRRAHVRSRDRAVLEPRGGDHRDIAESRSVGESSQSEIMQASQYFR